MMQASVTFRLSPRSGFDFVPVTSADVGRLCANGPCHDALAASKEVANGWVGDAVHAALPIFSNVQDALLDQVSQMDGNGALGFCQVFEQLALTQLAFHEELQNPEPIWLSERLE